MGPVESAKIALFRTSNDTVTAQRNTGHSRRTGPSGVEELTIRGAPITVYIISVIALFVFR
jgi:hypothetical protein